MIDWFMELPILWKLIIMVGYLCFAVVAAAATDLVNPHLRR